MSTSIKAPRRLSAPDRRQAILAAAKQVFGSTGYHTATTREIAAAAGVSEALLYQHFDSKRELFEAVIQAAAGDLAARLSRAATAEDPLAAATESYFEFVEAEADLYRVFFRQALQADAAFAGLYRELTRRFLALCEASLGRLPGSERRELVGHALAGMVSELGLWWVEDRSWTRSELAAHATRMGRAIYLSEVADDRSQP